MSVTFYSEEDAVYVRVSNKPIGYGKDLDDKTHIDFSNDGSVVGVEFLNVSGGIDLDDIPDIDKKALASMLGQRNIKVFA